ncbi:aminotransferase class I/II-fold pyridoxal phosphate-dependent enzyme [Robertkochia solimangrovi]|uniref:aminotransferase class I/II-fold pyridoxal phosphate-dependent enzyme n=1 Tax=Robertkochia solimangrovi TaxID=2213046 RepID=UPI001180A6A5|nr:aminotransferase class I/II-fold pyridoxal phosphate-dependent enzyme [Robertkochia solimangrovi]TRZ45815.1 8-amino-7-oxononanoate synthase [Robertkochia solimangrovi]
MEKFPGKLRKKLIERESAGALRQLSGPVEGVDFYSNDYLGFSNEPEIEQLTSRLMSGIPGSGATGSRLISGNHRFYEKAEAYLTAFYKAEAALIFNSGYDANVGLFSSIPDRNDLIVYDSLIHASIRDGIQMGHAQSYKFPHNDLDALDRLLKKLSAEIHARQDGINSEIYVVTESVFSMDGDSPDLSRLSDICSLYKCRLIVDEAHAVGVCGKDFKGLTYDNEAVDVFIRIVTFGKGMGCHGAAILGSEELKSFMVNYTRSFIYTTALSPHAVAGIIAAHKFFERSEAAFKLQSVIDEFRELAAVIGVNENLLASKSAIQGILVPGNEEVRAVAQVLNNNGLIVKAIMSPTVAKGQERIRICLHSFNSLREIEVLLNLLAKFVSS